MEEGAIGAILESTKERLRPASSLTAGTDATQCVKELNQILRGIEKEREFARQTVLENGRYYRLGSDDRLMREEEDALFTRMQDLKSPSFVEPLICALKHKDYIHGLGDRVMRLLTAIGEPAVLSLIAALSGPDDLEVAWALVDIGDQRALGPLIDHAMKGGFNYPRLIRAIRLAAKVGGAAG